MIHQILVDTFVFYLQKMGYTKLVVYSHPTIKHSGTLRAYCGGLEIFSVSKQYCIYNGKLSARDADLLAKFISLFDEVKKNKRESTLTKLFTDIVEEFNRRNENDSPDK